MNRNMTLCWDASFKLEKKKPEGFTLKKEPRDLTEIITEESRYIDLTTLDHWLLLEKYGYLNELKNIKFPCSSVWGIIAWSFLGNNTGVAHSVLNGTLMNRALIVTPICQWLTRYGLADYATQVKELFFIAASIRNQNDGEFKATDVTTVSGKFFDKAYATNYFSHIHIDPETFEVTNGLDSN